MRTLVYILVSIVIGILHTNAQEESDSKKTHNDISFSWDGDLSFSGDENMYFSTSDSEDTYKVRAGFARRKTAKIRAYLIEELDKKNLSKSGSNRQWLVKYKGDKAYEIKVDEGSLRIFVDKELVSTQLLNKLKVISENIKNYTSDKSDEKE